MTDPLDRRSTRLAMGVAIFAAAFIALGVSVATLAQDATVPPDASPTPPDASPSPLVQSPSPALTAAVGPSFVAERPLSDDRSADDVVPTVTVEAGDLWFAPTEFAIPADEPTLIVLDGVGRVAHNLIVDELGLQLHVGPGYASEVTVQDLPPGTYTFYCSIYGHRRAGMFGTLTIE